ATCLIHVWPIILAGNVNLYLYVHAANYLVFIMAMTIVAPPPKFLMILIAGMLALFIAPFSLILAYLGDYSMLKFFLSDSAYGILLGAISAYMNFNLRKRLATEEVRNKRRIEKFVGNLVSESIFENNDSLVKPRMTNAYIMAMDLRGFTKFSKTASPELASQFKEK